MAIVYLTRWIEGESLETEHPCFDAALDEAGAWCADEDADLVEFSPRRFEAMRGNECVALFTFFVHSGQEAAA